jgi:hypothetical protein
MLLCQERFLARLGSIAEGSAFIWKGGSLILRLYRTEGQPRYTIDIDFSVSGISTDSVSCTSARHHRARGLLQASPHDDALASLAKSPAPPVLTNGLTPSTLMSCTSHTFQCAGALAIRSTC